MRTLTLGTHAFFGLGLASVVSLASLGGCSDSGSSGGYGDDIQDASIDHRSTVDANPAGASATGAPDATRDTSTGPADASVADASRDAGSRDASDASALADAGTTDAGSSLIGRWTFDEGSGATSVDRSGHGHDAALKGAAAWSAAGRSGGGLLLDGTTGYADVGATLVDPAKSFTVACWVKLAVANTWAVAVSEDDVNGSAFGLKLRGDNSNTFDFDFQTSDAMSPGFVVAQSKSTAVASAWTHLAGVYDKSGGGAIRVYVNGVMEAKSAFAQSLVAPKGHLLIGRGLYNGAAGSFVNGVIDDVEVHDAALTDADIAAIFATGPADAGAPDAATDASTDATAEGGSDAGVKDAATTD
jgi:hypothetical protein